jgi:hypothetical protein
MGLQEARLAAWKRLRKSSYKNIMAGARAPGAKAEEEHEKPRFRHAEAGAKVQEIGEGRQPGDRHPREKGRSLLVGRGAPEAISEAKGDAPSRTSRHMTPPVSGAAWLIAGRGQVAPALPDLSRCEGSRVLTPGNCLACSNRPSQLTPCRDWPS